MTDDSPSPSSERSGERATDHGQDAVWRLGPVYSESDRTLARLVARPVREFLRVETAGSVLLLAAAVVALVWANSPWTEAYDSFWHTTITLDIGVLTLEDTLQHWVNDALMVIFFFVVGLEIKYELVHGDLRDPKTAALPIVAAVGGMVVPAGIYAVIVAGGEGASGWGIPMATDIAFAVGVLGLLGRRIPSAARLFLLTLAIVDDIGAILVIAVFYTDDLNLIALAIAIALLGLMLVMRRLRIWSVWAYVVVGVLVWLATFESGVHATLAGVAIGLITPTRPLLEEKVARGYAQKALEDRHLDADELHRLRFLLAESVPVQERLQNRLHPVSSYFVLPVFALANAGVYLGGGVLGQALDSAVALGIAAGLVVGKPVGILLAAFLAVRLGLGRLPENTGWRMVAGLGAVGGIGFTVSLFIAGLSFPGDELLTGEAKVGILGGSLVAALLGVALLLLGGKQPVDAEDETDDAESARADT
ncbi:Na+/H+ antiporter NhaA [Nocardioides euryhalodurans]|uniref:Na(+)/H(+) antiporter NhaA n=1 Tax=Nocardioides euryhalodurans TaxID=2518370 RepID=A0A4P7GKQ4_9ACTN|nr:Na+/H+ antiporter NhaA [Nocardioides euryhalodurans]QBR92625.1 Na+/H+ antiporter NhaA [Nocardioides euryhalodurans]